jgi:hypothetical protein
MLSILKNAREFSAYKDETNSKYSVITVAGYWVMTPCSLVGGSNVLVAHDTSTIRVHIDPEDEGSTFPKIIRIYLPD